MTTVAERVGRGAALLDEKMPGWDKLINLDELWQRSACECVLGQLWAEDAGAQERNGGYWPALEQLGMPAYPTRIPTEYGFAAESADDYDELDAEWQKLILSRRSA